MSAAFALDLFGSAPCGFPNCILQSFHEGEHQFKTDKRLAFPGPLPNEDNERLAALVTPYGVGTRSYNRSAEKREMDRQLELAAARRDSVPRQEVLQPLRCSCPQRPYAHDVSIHKLLRSESYHPRLRYRYPWSLAMSERLELSTEKE